jgi:hypothetical protein
MRRFYFLCVDAIFDCVDSIFICVDSIFNSINAYKNPVSGIQNRNEACRTGKARHTQLIEVDAMGVGTAE